MTMDAACFAVGPPPACPTARLRGRRCAGARSCAWGRLGRGRERACAGRRATAMKGEGGLLGLLQRQIGREGLLGRAGARSVAPAPDEPCAGHRTAPEEKEREREKKEISAAL